MSVIAVAVKHLMAAGITGGALLAAIQEMEESLYYVKTARQLRNKKYYESKKADESVLKASETSYSDATPPQGSDGFSLEPFSLTPNPSPKENPPIGGQKKNPSRGSRLTPEWSLPQEWGEWAETLGLDGKTILLEEQKFRDFWIAKTGPNATKANWEATWRNWIRRYLEGNYGVQAQRA